MKKLLFGAVISVMLFLLALPAVVSSQAEQDMAKQKEFRIERSISEAGVACIQCHKQEHPGIFGDWANSRHANANITCIDCHRAEQTDPDVSKEHFRQYEKSDSQWGRKQYRVPVAGVVTPKDCSRCHPDEAEQYKRSKHANTLEIIWKIDPWLNKGMNSDFERASGCFYCHGTVLETDEEGNLIPETWPNVGVGRMNMDGSKGSCSSCHTRHRFSVMEARKPQACGQCHLGPDHPQIEIYTESKHGAIYDSFGDEYNWDAAPGTWSPGVDYRAPTCASCHMSGAGTTRTTHDVTERLSWEIQAPLTVRPSDFKAFPAKTNWEVERKKMKEICLQCHGDNWVDDHYATFDKVVEEYNEVYFKPARDLMNELYEKGLVDDEKMFDEKIEVEYYELWHHEGRRARMGAAMMAPDYTWWHGFYEVKHRYNSFMKEGRELIKHNKKAEKAPDFPNATGRTTRPEAIFGSQ
ncbi:MAG: cytochrome c3 family protein [Desulfobacteraceae bacterium]|nr:cytochrome c3 family protein [Desulfobacteraceae bacterium]